MAQAFSGANMDPELAALMGLTANPSVSAAAANTTWKAPKRTGLEHSKAVGEGGGFENDSSEDESDDDDADMAMARDAPVTTAPPKKAILTGAFSSRQVYVGEDLRAYTQELGVVEAEAGAGKAMYVPPEAPGLDD